MAEAEEEAAWAICALRFADLGGTPPAWRKPLPDADPPPEALDPAVAAAARMKRMRASPASPLDYSGGSAASTSGGAGADEGSTSSAEGRVGPTAATNNKVGMIGGQPLIRRFQTPPAKNPRPGKKKALPDLQREVRSLVEENEMLRKETEDLHRACAAASAENRTLQLRLNKQNSPTGTDASAARMKQEPDVLPSTAPPPLVQCDDGEVGGFRIPDLNLPVSDDL